MIRKSAIFMLLLALAWVATGWLALWRLESSSFHDTTYLLVPTPTDALMIGLTIDPFVFQFTRSLFGVAVTIPIWFAILLLGTYPAFTFLRGPLRRWRRRHLGLCLKCGYDLTGNTTGICPECGVPV